MWIWYLLIMQSEVWIQNSFLMGKVLVFILAIHIVCIETKGKDSKETWETNMKIFQKNPWQPKFDKVQ